VGIVLICSFAGAQSGVPGLPPAPTQAEAPEDALGRSTPRGTVLGFLRAARDGDNEAAVQFLNTRLRGQAAAGLAHQLLVVLDRRLPAGLLLAKLSNRPDGSSPSLIAPDQLLIGTISSQGGNVDILVERVDRGRSGLLWLFSSNTLNAVPRLYRESDAITIEKVIPKFLSETQIAHIPLFEWLALLVGIPLLYLFTGLLNRLLSPMAGLVRRRMRKREALPDPKFLPTPVRLLIVALITHWTLSGLALPLLAREFWSTMTRLIAIAASIWMLITLNRASEGFLSRRLKLGKHGQAAVPILRLGRRVIDAILLFAGILAGLRLFGLNLTAALAGLGVGGIAIALAAQKTLENVIGGISVVFDRAMRVGELVRAGDKVGFVEHIGIRSTRIRTLDRTLISIPNGQIANVSLERISIRDKFWFHHTLSLCRETSVSRIREILARVENLLEQNPRVESGSMRVRFLGFGPSSLDVEIFAYALCSDWNHFLATQQDLLLELMEIIEATGARLAYPSQTLYLARSNTLGRDAQHHDYDGGQHTTDSTNRSASEIIAPPLGQPDTSGKPAAAAAGSPTRRVQL
jgi:MscS family membrane protein